MKARNAKVLVPDTDWWTILLYLALCLLGWMTVYSSLYNPETPQFWDMSKGYGKQLLWMGVSFVLAFLILLTDSKFFNAFSYVIYGIIILLNIAVIFVSDETKGAHAWFALGGFKLQPAEFAKFSAALALSKYLSGYNIKFSDLRTQLKAALFVLVPMGLILLQNDTGSALVFLSFIFVFYREGLSGILLVLGFTGMVLAVLSLIIPPLWLIGSLLTLYIIITYTIRPRKQLFWLLTGGFLVAILMVASVDYAFEHALQPHQKTRINVLLGKEIDLKGAGYNVHQSKSAIGSGGFWGKGFLEGNVTKLNFVPEHSTDFIFCTIGEEGGWMGALLLIALQVAMIWRILILAERQRTRFNRVYGYSVASILFFHFTINIGMTIGLLPVIGIPLPFISYGGSSLMSFTILLFILIKLDAHRMFDLSND